MKRIGLTGGIGMGKSTAGDLLRQLGVSVVDTDDLARQVVEPGQPGLAAIRRDFGDAFLDESGRLRRGEMARLVFADAAARARLEAIVHPLIQEAWEREVALWTRAGIPVGVVIIPLLFETGAANRFDAIVCLGCSEATQRQRLAGRGWSPEQMEGRLRAQLPLERKIQQSHFLVWTDTTLEVHRAQMERVLSALG